MAEADGTVTVVGLSKRFGPVKAVDNLSFSVTSGTITGFLGPNGAGKTTTLRMLLGLVTPDSGTATIGGRTYGQLDRPMRTVGAALEASSFHPARTARNHLRILCAATGLPGSRVDEVLDQVGLADVGNRKVKGFSTGMRQRLALAGTLLGDPQVLVLDEPANGLDPEGISWLRGFLRHLAGEGRTILVSSHVLSEVEQTVDDVVIIARGQLIREGPLSELMASTSRAVRVRSPQLAEFGQLLTNAGSTVTPDGDGSLLVHDAEPATVGRFAFTHRIELHELALETSPLEEVFLELTADTGGIR